MKVNDEWTTSLSLVDGSRQTMDGWTVNEVTAPMPQFDLTDAVDEIKADMIRHGKFQKMHVQLVTGGQIDILLGELYRCIFPVPIHTLENGLTIYETKVSPFDSKVNSLIGGPHKSFEFMAQHVGGASVMFTQLMQRLDTYKKIGPPPIQYNMSLNDEEFCKKQKEWEMGSYEDELLDEFDQIMKKSEMLSHGTIDANPGTLDANLGPCDISDNPVFSNNVICSGCNEIIQPSLVESEESIQALKKLQSNEEGMQISYRCPRCRDCVDCKKSFETERVSLREEQEDQMVHDSIRIDWENKQIECKLPVRGEEHQFLSNNRDIALKILDQQCNKHHKDVETRELICKSFDKLMKNGHMVLWDSLTEDEKKVIEAKKVSHWLPWRVVFKDSLSTPCRAVFDASSNTKVDADGNGGRSLNDLVVKGKVTTLNLMKMITRFQAGQHAVQGDLKQFYASIKLVLEQWNLQRVLFRENLDPKGKLIEAIIKSLIWGIKCVSALSEASVIKLAEFIKEKLPDLYKLLVDSRFCDDIGASSNSMEKLKATTKEADNLFDSVGLACKGWSYSGEKPSVDVSEDGLISIGGMKWDPIMDTLEVLIPKLHFSRKSRGRLIVGTQVFEGSMMEEMEEFVPKDLSRRTIFSKNSSIYDPCGKLAPVLGILKVDLRLVSKLTEEWDDTIPASARSKWLKNFMLLERLRGMKFQRAMMPSDAVSSRMNLIVAGDVAEANVEMFGAWARFKRKMVHTLVNRYWEDLF